MAGFSVTGLDDVINMLDKLSNKSNVDNICKKAVDAAKGKVESTMKAALAVSERGPKSTGSIAASVKATNAKVNSYGVFSVAKPNGRDKKGVRNGEKAAYLEHGTKNMNARPWRSKAASAAEGPCIRIMEEVVASEMGAK